MHLDVYNSIKLIEMLIESCGVCFFFFSVGRVRPPFPFSFSQFLFENKFQVAINSFPFRL